MPRGCRYATQSEVGASLDDETTRTFVPRPNGIDPARFRGVYGDVQVGDQFLGLEANRDAVPSHKPGRRTPDRGGFADAPAFLGPEGSRPPRVSVARCPLRWRRST